MEEQLQLIEKRYNELANLLGDPEVVKDQSKYQKYSKEFSDIEDIVAKYNVFKKIDKEINDSKELIKTTKEKELVELAEQELETLLQKKESIEKELEIMLLPKDPNDNKNVIMELRAGTGGEESALFVADLFRMYSKYAESQNWKIDIMNSSPTGIGGFKEIIFMVEGKGVYSKLKYEAGTHRVQRVPETEASGRIHTSAVTVAVLPEAEEVEVEINQDDIKIDIFRSSGPGGQSVNTTDSAVRITHIPTGIVVSCQDERSQLKNKIKAMQVLRARLLDKYKQEQFDQVTKNRRMQIGTGDRSEKIRTYNFPQNRLTDHRIGLTLYNLDKIMEGNIDEVISALASADQTEKLKNLKI